MASMLVFHTGDPGSIPGLGTFNFKHTKNTLQKARIAHLVERRLSKSEVLSSILNVGILSLTISYDFYIIILLNNSSSR